MLLVCEEQSLDRPEQQRCYERDRRGEGHPLLADSRRAVDPAPSIVRPFSACRCRVHEETAKYKFWLYDYTGVTDLFGTEFITKPPRPRGDGGTGGGDEGGDDGGGDGPSVAEIGGTQVVINPQGRFILVSREGRDTPIPVDEYRREVMARVLAEAHTYARWRSPTFLVFAAQTSIR